MKRARSGDPDAIAELYTRYGRDVHSVAMQLTRSADDADDVLQDVFVSLPVSLASYEARGNFGGWLKSVAIRLSLMLLRTKRIQAEVDLDDVSAPPVSTVEPMITRIALDSALGQIPDPYRVVFVLKVVEGYSHEEIGEMLGIDPKHSAVRLFRARKMLQKILAGRA